MEKIHNVNDKDFETTLFNGDVINIDVNTLEFFRKGNKTYYGERIKLKNSNLQRVLFCVKWDEISPLIAVWCKSNKLYCSLTTIN